MPESITIEQLIQEEQQLNQEFGEWHHARAGEGWKSQTEASFQTLWHLKIQSYYKKCKKFLQQTDPILAIEFDQYGTPKVLHRTGGGPKLNEFYANTSPRIGDKVDFLISKRKELAAAPTPSQTAQSDKIFDEIRTAVSSSSLAANMQQIIANDLNDAQRAYNGIAYKSCVVMLGAAVEGLMLGTLQRTDVLVSFVANPAGAPPKIQSIGTGDPKLSDKIGSDLHFEDMRTSINHIIDGISDLGIDDIQDFRNAIHPWKSITDPVKYLDFDEARAIHYLASLKKIVDVLLPWTP